MYPNDGEPAKLEVDFATLASSQSPFAHHHHHHHHHHHLEPNNDELIISISKINHNHHLSDSLQLNSQEFVHGQLEKEPHDAQEDDDEYQVDEEEEDDDDEDEEEDADEEGYREENSDSQVDDQNDDTVDNDHDATQRESLKSLPIKQRLSDNCELHNELLVVDGEHRETFIEQHDQIICNHQEPNHQNIETLNDTDNHSPSSNSSEIENLEPISEKIFTNSRQSSISQLPFSAECKVPSPIELADGKEAIYTGQSDESEASDDDEEEHEDEGDEDDNNENDDELCDDDQESLEGDGHDDEDEDEDEDEDDDEDDDEDENEEDDDDSEFNSTYNDGLHHRHLNNHIDTHDLTDLEQNQTSSPSASHASPNLDHNVLRSNSGINNLTVQSDYCDETYLSQNHNQYLNNHTHYHYQQHHNHVLIHHSHDHHHQLSHHQQEFTHELEFVDSSHHLHLETSYSDNNNDCAITNGLINNNSTSPPSSSCSSTSSLSSPSLSPPSPSPTDTQLDGERMLEVTRKLVRSTERDPERDLRKQVLLKTAIKKLPHFLEYSRYSDQSSEQAYEQHNHHLHQNNPMLPQSVYYESPHLHPLSQHQLSHHQQHHHHHLNLVDSQEKSFYNSVQPNAIQMSTTSLRMLDLNDDHETEINFNNNPNHHQDNNLGHNQHEASSIETSLDSGADQLFYHSHNVSPFSSADDSGVALFSPKSNKRSSSWDDEMEIDQLTELSTRTSTTLGSNNNQYKKLRKREIIE